MIGKLLPVFGLFLTIGAHLWFYLKSDTGADLFTGRLSTEEDLLMDSMVIIGGVQISYFLWRSMEALAGTSFDPVINILNAIGFFLLTGTIYMLYRLVENSEAIVENYEVNTNIGEEDG